MIDQFVVGGTTLVEAKLLNRNIIGVDINDMALNRCREKISFEVMQIFQEADFKLKEIIIKEQHNCKATGYWKTNSIKYNFLLIAHKYLFVFKK